MRPFDPYISIVVAARNDNYGGDFTARFQAFVHWNVSLFDRYGLDCELVIVNWNPIASNAPLEKSVRIPDSKHVRCRVIEVPAELHGLFDDQRSSRVPLYEFAAKNVGIRRAGGRFVLCTNADILLHPELVRVLADRRLAAQCYYRADRCDFEGGVDLTGSIGRNLRVIEDNVMTVWTRGAAVRIGGPLNNQVLRRIRQRAAVTRVIKRVARSALGIVVPGPRLYNPALEMHLHACGDFTLTHRDHWHALRGYPETTEIATHTDSLLIAMLRHRGMTERCFEWPVFHQEHKRRYDPGGDRADAMHRQYRFLVAEAWAMRKRGAAIIYNNQHWGLSDHVLAETEL